MNPPYEPVGRLIDQYDHLASAALSGDGRAARMLYLELQTCNSIAAMEARERRSPNHSHVGRPTEGVEVLRCDGLEEQHYAHLGNWAKLAAESGDYLGRQYWGAELGETSEALSVFESFWNDGNASALPAMSSLHAKGVRGREPDWVTAYALHFIYFKLDEAARTTGHSWAAAGHRIDTHLALSDQLRNLGGMLRPGQQQEAEALAYRLLAENGNCCTGNF